VRALSIFLAAFIVAISAAASAQIPETFSSISAGQSFTCGIATDSQVVCWGADDDGQASPPSGAFVQVAAASFGTHACALDAAGNETCWGSDPGADSSVAVETMTQISSGTNYSCGVLPTPTGAGNAWWVRCWGFMGGGPPQNVHFVEIDNGDRHTCGFTDTGTLVCWGGENFGEAVPPPGTFTQVRAGNRLSCGVKSDATLACWGGNFYQQAVPPPGTFSQVDAGGTFGCAIRTDGTLACWGNNSSGQASPPAGTYVALSVGSNHGCALKSDGTVACWGNGAGTPPVCGNGSVEGREVCDDGNNVTGDYCATDCRSIIGSCGDGTLQASEEECDDGSGNSNSLPDACRTDCRQAHCGDGTIDTAEVCDDGNIAAGDDCSSDCLVATGPCGDGSVQPTEECDDGPSNSDTTPNACRTSCLLPACNDGVADSGEVCDDGSAGADDYCSDDCLTAFSCGDSAIQTAFEECDDGGANSDTTPDACRSDCALPECGDGIVDPSYSEDCDDVGESADCDDDCSTASCGDGQLNATADEECDDGNSADGDACSAACGIVRCEFDAPSKARSIKAGMVRAFEQCSSPNTLTEGGLAACSPAALSSFHLLGDHGACSVRVKHDTVASAPGVLSSEPTFTVRCKGLTDGMSLLPLEEYGWAIGVTSQPTTNDQTCAGDSGRGDMTVIAIPNSLYLGRGIKNGSLRITSPMQDFRECAAPGAWPLCSSLEHWDLSLQDAYGNPFARLGASAMDGTAGCVISRPQKATSLKAELVRAYEPCEVGYNTAYGVGVPACALPTSTSAFEFGADGRCKLAMKARSDNTCADGSAAPCFDAEFKLSCKDLRDGTGELADASSGTGWRLRLVARVTTDDAIAGVVTTADSTIDLPIPDASRGELKLASRLTDLCSSPSTPCAYRFSPCTSLEILRATVVDPSDGAFATVGTSAR